MLILYLCVQCNVSPRTIQARNLAQVSASRLTMRQTFSRMLTIGTKGTPGTCKRFHFFVILQYIYFYDEKFPCLYCECDYKATRKGNLQSHINSIHDGQTFPCKHCGSEFTEKGSLKTHINSIHEGQKFPCSHCEYKAPRKGGLLRHIKTVHEGMARKTKNKALLIADISVP